MKVWFGLKEDDDGFLKAAFYFWKLARAYRTLLPIFFFNLLIIHVEYCFF